MQATGSRLATVVQGISSILIGVLIGFVYCWELALVMLGFGPLIAIAGFIEMRVMQGNSHFDKEALELAGKVSFIPSNILLYCHIPNTHIKLCDKCLTMAKSGRP